MLHVNSSPYKVTSFLFSSLFYGLVHNYTLVFCAIYMICQNRNKTLSVSIMCKERSVFLAKLLELYNTFMTWIIIRNNKKWRALQENPIIACIFTNFDGFHFSWEKCHPNDNGSYCNKVHNEVISMCSVLWLIPLFVVWLWWYHLVCICSCPSILHFGKNTDWQLPVLSKDTYTYVGDYLETF